MRWPIPAIKVLTSLLEVLWKLPVVGLPSSLSEAVSDDFNVFFPYSPYTLNSPILEVGR